MLTPSLSLLIRAASSSPAPRPGARRVPAGSLRPHRTAHRRSRAPPAASPYPPPRRPPHTRPAPGAVDDAGAAAARAAGRLDRLHGLAEGAAGGDHVLDHHD